MNREQLQNLRTDYQSDGLKRSDLNPNPIIQFKNWFSDALINKVVEPNAFSLATCDKKGQPQNRIVLVKEIREDGLVFFTNYDSQKGKQIEENPSVSACFFWQKQSRQIRIEGKCIKLTDDDSDRYFHKRPLNSRIGAITSPQSQVISSRKWLIENWNKNKKNLGESFARPKNWGGYLIKGSKYEFWQGQPSRLHDRFVYEFINENWKISRLAP